MADLTIGGLTSAGALTGAESVVISSDGTTALRTTTQAIANLGGGGDSSAVTKDIAQTGHGFVAENALYHNGTIYAKAKADSATTSDVVGIVSAVIDADNFTLTTSGNITLTGATAGQYFLSDTTAGLATLTPPTTNGYVRKPIMVATSSTSGIVQIFLGITIGSSGGGGVTIGSGVSGGTANRVLYVDSVTNLAQSSNLTFNGNNLGVKTTAPLAPLSVGDGSYNDANVPMQISTAGSATETNFGVNKNGGYGFLLGFKNGGGFNSITTLGYMRMVTTDSFGIVMNNSNPATVWDSSGNVHLGGNITTIAGASSTMSVLASGRVGVGIVTPLARFSAIANSASFTPITIGTNATFVGNFADNLNDSTGIQMGNVNAGTSADFRLLIKDTTDHYVGLVQFSTGNSGATVMGQARTTSDFILSTGGTGRNLVIGPTTAHSLILGTNNTTRLTISSAGLVTLGGNLTLGVNGLIQSTGPGDSIYMRDGNGNNIIFGGAGSGNIVTVGVAGWKTTMNGQVGIATAPVSTNALSVVGAISQTSGGIVSSGSFTGGSGGAASATIVAGQRWQLASSGTAGDLTLYNNSGTSPVKIQFGGITASFPSVENIGADLIIRSANATNATRVAIGAVSPAGMLDITAIDDATIGFVLRAASVYAVNLWECRDSANSTRMRINQNFVFFPVQATTAAAPAYVLGGMYFDTTLNKLRIGGATGWETCTSI
jgi:hypothetical protein